MAVDLSRAAQWYKLGANLGDAASSTNLGYMYANAQGVAQDDQHAVALYRHAADLNNPSGINNLGYMYENGRGVPVDLNMAMSLYRRAADLGERNARVEPEPGAGAYAQSGAALTARQWRLARAPCLRTETLSAGGFVL